MSCIFCKIAAREIPSEMVGENEGAFAFLDIRPLTRGHVLVIPKLHSERFAAMDAKTAQDVMRLAQDTAQRLERRLGAAGLTIAFNDGKAAGQEVMHVHMHLVPRAEGDGHGPVHALFAAPYALKEGEIGEIRQKLTG